MTSADASSPVKLLCLAALVGMGVAVQAQAQAHRPGISKPARSPAPPSQPAAKATKKEKPSPSDPSLIAAKALREEKTGSDNPEDSGLVRFLADRPKVRDLVLRSRAILPRVVADYLNNKVEPLKKIILWPVAFKPVGRVAGVGRVAVVSLGTELRTVDLGDRIVVAVTVRQPATGALATGTWHTVAGTRRSSFVVAVTRNRKGFQAGPAEASAVAIQTNRFGVVVSRRTWKRTITLK